MPFLLKFCNATTLPCCLHHVPCSKPASFQASCAVLSHQVQRLLDGLPPLYQVRLGEKETLESTLKFFDDRIERLSELEFYQVRTCLA